MVLSTRVALVATLALTLAPTLAHAQSFNYSTTSGGDIPDASTTGISSTITVTDSFFVADFASVTITGLNHSFLGDLIITLSTA